MPLSTKELEQRRQRGRERRGVAVRTTPTAKLRPWRPRELPKSLKPERLRYIVVEEQLDDVVVLTVAPWPRVQSDGRIRFPNRDKEWHVPAVRADLERYLAKKRQVHLEGLTAAEKKQFKARAVSVGDVFAAVVKGQPAESGRGAPPRVASWLGARVYDITGHALEAAKASYLIAQTPALDARELDEIESATPVRGPDAEDEPHEVFE